jgi:hypothetical protein
LGVKGHLFDDLVWDRFSRSENERLNAGSSASLRTFKYEFSFPQALNLYSFEDYGSIGFAY